MLKKERYFMITLSLLISKSLKEKKGMNNLSEIFKVYRVRGFVDPSQLSMI